MDDIATKKAQEMEKQALKRSRSRDLNLLGEKLEEGQLVFWPETERGVPNELVRCAVFSAKNRREARRIFRANEPMRVPVLGGGEVIYIGEELRQDDENRVDAPGTWLKKIARSTLCSTLTASLNRWDGRTMAHPMRVY